jgi:hypothetical protein
VIGKTLMKGYPSLRVIVLSGGSAGCTSAQVATTQLNSPQPVIGSLQFKKSGQQMVVEADEVGDNESHPLASPMEIVGVLVEKYEEEHVPEFTAE